MISKSAEKNYSLSGTNELCFQLDDYKEPLESLKRLQKEVMSSTERYKAEFPQSTFMC